MKTHHALALFTLFALSSAARHAAQRGPDASPRDQRERTPLLLQTRAGALRLGQLGAEVACLADLDGDGIGDWMAARGGPSSGAQAPELQVYSGASGTLLYALPGQGVINQLFLQTLDDVGDFDGDGVTDFAFGNANAPRKGSLNVGAVVVHSGATGKKLLTRWGLRSFGGFGASLASLGDVDGDQVPDFVVGAIGTLDENAWVVSGATGNIHLRVRVPGGLGDIEFGWAAARLDDIDGDLRADFAIGTRSGGFVDAYSSASGVLLFQARGGVSFGRRLASIGDVDGDGSSDLLVGEPAANLVHLLSGRDGATILTVGAPDGGCFGTSIASVLDIDRDHLPDFIVGDDGFEQRRGRVQVFSSRTGCVLFEVIGSQPQDRLGQSVAGGADFDGDGRPDFLIGAPGVDGTTKDQGEVSLWSGWRVAGHALQR